MHKHRLPDRTIVYSNTKNLLESTVLVCREFADPNIRRWCVMTRDMRKPADNWDAWTNIGDYRTKREAVIAAVGDPWDHPLPEITIMG